jgi:iron(III) transport system permease protein
MSRRGEPGATAGGFFRSITLPLLRPGCSPAPTIVLIWSFTELGTPLHVRYYRVTPVQVFFRIYAGGGSPLPYALVVIMLLTSIALYAVGKLAAGPRARGGGHESVCPIRDDAITRHQKLLHCFRSS